MTTFPDRFAGKIALVTGAVQGIGRNVALRLARERACVALVDRSSAGVLPTEFAIILP
jgi:dihydroxycyclohexadiene carboxylate dehydrogenase